MNLIRLPLPPSSNRYWRHANGRTYVSEEARAYKLQAGWVARTEGLEPLDGALSVTLDVYAERQRGDLDNSIKVLFDSLNGVAWHDDGQIVEIHARRFIAPKPKRGKREGFVLFAVERVA